LFARASQYINANFVTGYNNNPKRFIAAQGPTKATISHFWSGWGWEGVIFFSTIQFDPKFPIPRAMMFEHSVEIVVMMTGLEEGGRSKCERYWPARGQIMEDAEFSVRGKIHNPRPTPSQRPPIFPFQITTLDEVDAGHYVLSILQLTEKSSRRQSEIRHFWFVLGEKGDNLFRRLPPLPPSQVHILA
jgi:protein tyrosine phosphatase